MGFVGLLPPSATRPKSAFLAGRAGIHNVRSSSPVVATTSSSDSTCIPQIVRDQFSIQTWLAAGALAQGCLILLVGRLALLPAAAYIFYSIADAYLTAIGLKANPLMSDVLMTKFTAQIPDARGDFSGEPAGSDVVVFLIGTRNNHPLGVLAPGYREMGEYMMNMAKELDARADEFGFLGMTSWIANGQRETRNEFLEVCYFRSVEGLLKFAHSELHRKGWSWYSSQVKKLPHLSIYHETYHVPKVSCEFASSMVRR